MENSGAFLSEARPSVWLPGEGVVDLRQKAVARACREYDESFKLGRHNETGDWVICLREDQPPVFTFGRELPDPRDVHKILSQYDIKRRGVEIMQHLAREAQAQRDARQHEMSEHNGELAEHFESALRARKTGYGARVFVPKGL